MSSDYTTNYYYSSFDSVSNNENIIIRKDKTKLITLGKCSRFYLYILISGLFKLLSLLLLGDNKIFEDGIGLL